MADTWETETPMHSGSISHRRHFHHQQFTWVRQRLARTAGLQESATCITASSGRLQLSASKKVQGGVHLPPQATAGLKDTYQCKKLVSSTQCSNLQESTSVSPPIHTMIGHALNKVKRGIHGLLAIKKAPSISASVTPICSVKVLNKAPHIIAII